MTTITMETQDRRRRLASLRAAAVGNALEWFDWTLYGTFSAYLAMNLFDPSDPTSALLATLGVFAGGFLARPVGGWLFGRIGDRYGRKFTLVLTMCLLASTSLGIAVLPTYEQAGVLASVLLFACRLMQGLAHGGESGVAYTYVAEIAPASRRGFWSSSVFVSVTLGVMAATGLAALLTSWLGKAAMEEWGWRVGFAIGALLGVYALFLRRSASESDVFEHQAEQGGGLKITKRQAWLIARNIVMIAAASNATYYTWVTFAPATAIATKGMDPSGAYTASLIAQLICLLWLPVCGWLADRYGRKPMVMAFGLGVALAVFPVSHLVTDQPWTLFVAQLIGLLVWALLAAIFPAVVAEQVPTGARAMGVGFISSLSVAIFGGTAPYINTWLGAHGLDWVYTAYVGALGLMAFVGGFLIKETAGMNLNDIGLPGQPRQDLAAKRPAFN
ncbi:Alpha-ketoglutarate permease [Achromobacter denitrificans]|uniref:MFS transporter n=1 Tax=Achromobacter denitrificans TaxID=32002 RepID=UPI0007885CB9|nr:MFS transporter [Achromobacter denitrificans]OLU00043.1 MFS transporter [Achromobacter denitrificans]QKH41101.1 MFS transporter [Achromobacter denitrificans]QKH51754.1 MFS transporter [Achromobacter denitrificans]CAB3720587.1 Alpha-ketoglutarate permease [Achromobacter denitrificans]SUU28123.1 Alpha-ketoglutarate permease [Achromobacter denitrificans]